MHQPFPPSRTDLGHPDLLCGVSILHVEDDSIIQFHMHTILGKLVRELHCAADGLEGLELYHRLKPDVVVSDIRLPRMNGLDMIAAIRETDPEVPVIVTSAYSDADYLLKAIELGVDKYLIKPFDHRQVIRAVSRAAESMARQREVNEANRFNRILLDINPGFIVVVDQGEVEYVNRTFLEFMGYSSLEEFILAGRGIEDFIENISGHHDRTRVSQWLHEIVAAQCQDVVVRLRGPQGEESRAYLATHNRFPDTDKYVIVLTDITPIDDERRSLASQASTDHLTGICNRLRFSEVLHQELNRARRYGIPFSLAMFDIDDFKRVNDAHGHEIGDRVLIELAQLVGLNIRANDVFARWGGEEFMLAVPGCDLEQTTHMAEKLLRLMHENPVGPENGITCSFGVTSYHHGESQEHLLRRVDEALYTAKRRGKNSVVAV
ncbi:response regulator receiver modulated diguanylate cyclase with PAS/PAC sensor [Desulfovibrio sp. X2]|uniref:diguanylate cyclase n=1 Tax=Desulfovibrio sp. X2 TaxID=941449 RepID=UPI000358CE27|nr:diguanylate cyclase [Desulfovibrio sp. X2]EPR43603.1 response regulator receiver modulated diguanylate cyclase with PAS/PAC sensor [Desulfovibrio sp. X2]